MTAVTLPWGPVEIPDIYLPLREPTDLILVERLLGTAAATLDLPALARVINRGRADLAGSPPGAIPELLERLVRQRLS